MKSSVELIPTSEVAYIAGLTDKEINRVVDEDVLPKALFDQSDGRRFSRIAGAFSRFYFDTRNDLSKALRRRVIADLTERLMQRKDWRSVASFEESNLRMDWSVNLPFGVICLDSVMQVARERALRVERAHQAVTVDADVMSGAPVFAGTRVPIDIVLGSIAEGVGRERLQAAYPFLTDDLIGDAQLYQQIHPRLGRPRKEPAANPAWPLVHRKKLREANTGA